jgi:hypothetical protein
VVFLFGAKSFYFITKYLCLSIYCFTYLVPFLVAVNIRSLIFNYYIYFLYMKRLCFGRVGFKSKKRSLSHLSLFVCAVHPPLSLTQFACISLSLSLSLCNMIVLRSLPMTRVTEQRHPMSHLRYAAFDRRCG